MRQGRTIAFVRSRSFPGKIMPYDSLMAIHPTAIVDSKADVDATADVRAYAIIDGPVTIGPRCCIYPHAYIGGGTTIGADCQIHPHAVIGHLPQDLAYKDGRSYCRIGDGTVVREGASIHRGTKAESETVVGERCYIMAYAHIAHNVRMGNDVKMANGALLAGYAEIGDGAFLSAYVGIHQFVRVGRLVMVGGLTKISRDIPPFFMADGRDECVGVNVVGVRRAGFTSEERLEIKQAYRILYRSGRGLQDAIDRLDRELVSAPGRQIVGFLRDPSKRGIIGGRRSPVTPAMAAPT